MNYAIAKLEFSTDPLSDTTPAWTNITTYCKSASWSSGVSRELDDPQAGGATFILKNLQRRFEPEYAAGAYYPNIVPGRRFRLTITADGVNYSQGIYYAQSWEVQYPDRGSPYSEVVVTCSDGFWRLALDRLPAMSPASAESSSDVILSDSPFAYYPLDENGGKTMNAAVGPSGVYKNDVTTVPTNPVTGDAAPAKLLKQTGYGRAKLDDENVWFDSGQLTLECVVTRGDNSSGKVFAGGPWDTTASDMSFNINSAQAQLYNVGAVNHNVAWTGTDLTAGTYHLAMTYDGSKLTAYLNGVTVGSDAGSGNIISPDANEFLYVGNASNHSPPLTDRQDTISHVAFYDHALTADRIAAHADAALNRGYSAQPAGSRIAAVATDPLWSTAGIPTGTVTAAARFQTGQTTLDEILTTARIEQPGSLFYFDDNGNPDYRSLQDTQTVAAIFGDQPGEIQYDSLNGLQMNDEVYNTSTVIGELVTGSTATNQTSVSDMGTRAQDATDLIITSNSDAALISQAIVDRFSTPSYRIDSISLNGSSQAGRTQILTREVGDTIRIKRRGEGGTPIDIITRILAKEKSLDVNGDLRCTWTVARGFNAALAVDHLGVVGYSELNTNFKLA